MLVGARREVLGLHWAVVQMWLQAASFREDAFQLVVWYNVWGWWCPVYAPSQVFCLCVHVFNKLFNSTVVINVCKLETLMNSKHHSTSWFHFIHSLSSHTTCGCPWCQNMCAVIFSLVHSLAVTYFSTFFFFLIEKTHLLAYRTLKMERI